ncbi:MAG: hypothetical protein ACR2PW_06680 [Gammaproteobacteria bacterium]
MIAPASSVLVSAFYLLPSSRHSAEHYFECLKRLLHTVKTQQVIFTDSHTRQQIFSRFQLSSIPHVRLVDWPMQNFKTQAYRAVFEQQYRHMEISAEAYVVEHYAIWNEKVSFVHQAMQLYPQQDFFVWIDAGSLRNDHYAEKYQYLPLEHLLRTIGDRVSMLEVKPMTEQEKQGFRQGKNPLYDGHNRRIKQFEHRIGAGILAGSRKAWQWFYRSYYHAIESHFIPKDLFIGREQQIFAYLRLKESAHFNIVPAQPHPYERDPWYFMLPYLSGHV